MKRRAIWQLPGCGLLIFLALTGCGEKKRPQTKIVPPPSMEGDEGDNSTPSPPTNRETNPSRHAGKPLYVETGLASWYGPPYNHRRAANGEIFDMHQPTAAHKTLPLNSVVRVTNLASGKSIVVRINDRGPFIGDRILDLSLAAAKEIDLWRPGVARVKMEVLELPKPMETGGRWCVQIGAFTDADEAGKLKARLAHRYKTAQVIQFAGPTGEWVRFRPMDDDRQRAQQVARETQASEGGVFLVRLD